MESAEFYRGSHDSLVLNINEIRRFYHLDRIPASEERSFLMEPTLLVRDGDIRGDLEADDPLDVLYSYGLEQMDGRAAFLFRRYDELP